MSVLNFSYADVKNVDKFKQYVQEAAILMDDADVEVVVRGEFSKTIRGDKCTPHIAAVFRYPNETAVENFYSSEKYKALIPLRDEACEMTINIYVE